MIRFQCLEGRLAGQQLEFDKQEVVLGRNEDCDVSLDDALCSRHHASIQKADSRYYLVDLGSTNGVRVNGNRVVRSELSYGDRFSLGKSIFVFLSEIVSTDDAREPVEISHTVIENTQSLGAIEKHFEEINARTLEPGLQTISQEELAELQRVNRQMHAIYSLSRAINSTLLLDDLYDLTSDHIFADLQSVERVCIFIAEKDGSALECVKTRSREGADDSPVSSDVLRRVEAERVGIMATDALSDDRFEESHTLINMHVRSLLCVPLATRKRFLGAIYAENCHRVSCFTQGDLELLTVLGNQVAVAIENALLYEELEVSFYETIRSLGNALEAKDKYTRGHSQRVASYAVGIGREMGLSREQVENIRIAAELHDIGKIAIHEGIIGSSKKLTDAEYEMIKKHPQLGVDILKPIRFLEPVLPAVLHHHERYNGKGYPDRLRGEDIPLDARILNLADAFDAMTTQRPYNDPRTFDDAISHCQSESGVSFDRNCVDALVRYMRTTDLLEDTGLLGTAEAVVAENPEVTA